MRYTINLSEEDYVRFNIFYNNNSKNRKFLMKIMQISLIVMILFNLFLFIESGVPFLLMTTILFVMMLVFNFKFAEYSIRKNISRLKKEGKLPFPSISEVEFQDSMIIQKYEQGEIRVKYTDIEHVYFEKGYIYIFIGAVQAIIIPHYCLGENKPQVIAYIIERTESKNNAYKVREK